MSTMIAYCGIICSECPSYVATMANDQAALESLAARAREEQKNPAITVQDVTCEGCLTESERLCSYCAQCDVRASARQKGVANCAHCAEYETCGTIAAFLEMAPEAKATLDKIHASL
jgi:hypothetical protein